jgi:hypothetical protein
LEHGSGCIIDYDLSASRAEKAAEYILGTEQIIYWPNGNHAEHFACGEADYRHSLASFQDEENYNNQYPSW